MSEVTVDEVWEEKDGTVALVLRQPDPWDAPGVIARLQATINGYISVIRDGPLIEKYPEYKGKKCKIRLVCYYEPPPEVHRKIDVVNHHLNQLGIGLVLMQIRIEKPQERRDRLKRSVRSLFGRFRGGKV